MKVTVKRLTELSVVFLALIALNAWAEQATNSGDEVGDSKSSDFSFTAAIKLHPSVVFGTTITPISTPSGLVPVADEVQSGTEMTPILLLNAKYKNVFVSLGHFFETSYDSKLRDTDQNSILKRNETDFNLGYYVLPGLGISLGYKELRSSASTAGSSKFRGPTIGVSGYGAISDNVGLYGSVGYGKLSLSAEGSPTELRRNTYYVAETGIAYSFDIGKALKSLSLTFGYRFQTVQSDKSIQTARVAVIGGNAAIVGARSGSVGITSRGPVLGIVASF